MSAVSTSAMRSGVSIDPVVHPLANTMTVSATGMNRSLFLRGAAAGSINVGDPVATSGEALIAGNVAWVAASEQNRLMESTDCYCGLTAPATTDDPLIYGLARSRLTIFGSGFGLVLYRRLPTLSTRYDPSSTGVLQGAPYNGTTNPAYLDSQFLAQSAGDLTSTTLFEFDAKKAFDFMLGPEAGGELAAMGGIQTDDSTTSPTALISYNRLRLWPNPPAGESFSSYQQYNAPRASQVFDSDGNWKPYHLRGPGLYDAWGHEILFFRADNGSAVFQSAGPDGYFVFKPPPGFNGTYNTPASAGAGNPASPDADATTDNISTNGSK